MSVTEQIDALETLTYDPFAYLVFPRVLAGLVMFPVVVGLAMVVGVAAGWLASVALLDLTSADFFKGARLFFLVFDVQYGLVKSASFGYMCGYRVEKIARRGIGEGHDERASTNGHVAHGVPQEPRSQRSFVERGQRTRSPR